MLNSMLYYIFAFFSGFLVKIVDYVEDEQKGNGVIKYPLTISYGMLIGYLISKSPFSMLFGGALIGQVVAGKIDKAHRVGFVVALLAMIFLGLPRFDVFAFFFFLLLAELDEMSLGGFWKKWCEYRIFLKIGAALYLITGRWDYIISILLFDGGYLLAEKGMKRRK